MYPNNTPWPGQQNQPSNNMDYLRSISGSEQQYLPEEPSQNPSGINTKKIVIFAIVMVLFVTAIAVVTIITGSSVTYEERKVVTAEEHEEQEELNSDLAKLVENDPNRNYESPNDYSPNYGAVPTEVIAEWKLNIGNIEKSATRKVAAMNSNILNYHLDDEDSVVAIVEPSGIKGRGKESKAVVIFASVPSSYDFVGFMVSDFNEDGTCKDKKLLPEETTVYFTRSELFNQLTKDAKFYLIRRK